MMAMFCAFGIHKWQGCKCLRCNRTRDERDEQHSWNGCVCTICGKKRNDAHAWNGCVCTICGEKRNEAHAWNGCVCTICGCKRSPLSQELHVGMTMGQVQGILGPPSAQLGGGALLGMFGNVSGSTRATSSISQRLFVLWQKPEGEFKLVFVGDKLAEIVSAP